MSGPDIGADKAGCAHSSLVFDRSANQYLCNICGSYVSWPKDPTAALKRPQFIVGSNQIGKILGMKAFQDTIVLVSEQGVFMVTETRCGPRLERVPINPAAPPT